MKFFKINQLKRIIPLRQWSGRPTEAEPPLPVHPGCVLIRKNRRIIENVTKNWKPLELAEKTQNVDKEKEMDLSADRPIDGTSLDPFSFVFNSNRDIDAGNMEQVMFRVHSEMST